MKNITANEYMYAQSDITYKYIYCVVQNEQS